MHGPRSSKNAVVFAFLNCCRCTGGAVGSQASSSPLIYYFFSQWHFCVEKLLQITEPSSAMNSCGQLYHVRQAGDLPTRTADELCLLYHNKIPLSVGAHCVPVPKLTAGGQRGGESESMTFCSKSPRLLFSSTDHLRPLSSGTFPGKQVLLMSFVGVALPRGRSWRAGTCRTLLYKLVDTSYLFQGWQTKHLFTNGCHRLARNLRG